MPQENGLAPKEAAEFRHACSRSRLRLDLPQTAAGIFGLRIEHADGTRETLLLPVR